MKKTAILVHLDGLDSVLPLVGGYLKAFALDDPAVRDAWQIELYSQSCRTKASRVIRDIVRAAPDLVAFSVYTWNAGLVARILPALRGLLPRGTRFLLGGVEVMNVAPRYVQPSWEDVTVCNGEGERTFRQLLLELSSERPDLARVGGVTFARDGEWVTTEGQPRIEDLSELVSPWLSGVFDDLPHKDVALYETNRGCPFACEFCFWGGAVGQKVYRLDLDLVKEELTSMGERGIGTISICDANFGILPRDVEIAEHIAEVHRRFKTPNRIVFNSSKVHPERVEAISRILSDAQLMTRHVFSLQSLNEHALKIAKRTGLARDDYRTIQQRLNGRRMSSLIELIWPLPGETLDSFKDGVDELCGVGGQTFLVYPLVWLNNTGFRENATDYGVVTLRDDDPAAGDRIVVRTNEVSFDEYLEGLRFVLGLYLLHDCRGLYATMQLANWLGLVRFRDVIDAFARFMDEARGPVADTWRAHLECFEDMAKVNARGILGNAVLVEHRADFDRLVDEFTRSRPEWFGGEHAELLAATVEYDLLTRPYIFVQTALDVGVELEHTRVLETLRRRFLVRARHDFPAIIDALRVGESPAPALLEPGEHVIEIDHRGFQLFMIPSRTRDEHHWLCTLAVQEAGRIEPRCTVERVAAASG